MQREKVVVIEDEADIREMIAYNLSREKYRVLTAADGEEGLDMVMKENPDLVLLDLMLPGLDGIEVCRQLKADSVTRDIPIIMVTARGEESDIVLGLGMGADDYVTKPFSPRELLARIRVVMRRGPLRGERDTSERIVRGNIVIDASRHEMGVDGESITLTATEFRLIHFLATHPGRVFTRAQLLNRVIGEYAYVIDRNIDVHVRSVRKKLGQYSNYIETIRGVGYRFRDTEED
jgi:phosphate regulon transcriptional regulator PhoB